LYFDIDAESKISSTVRNDFDGGFANDSGGAPRITRANQSGAES
jgi:hypothetical protein